MSPDRFLYRTSGNVSFPSDCVLKELFSSEYGFKKSYGKSIFVHNVVSAFPIGKDRQT